MKANWINQKNIDRQQWDKLVHQTNGASIYTLSFYLDATAIDWEAYIAEDFSFAIPVGIVRKGGVTRVYPPLFQRYIEPLGDISLIDWNAFEASLLKRYSKGDLHSKTAILPNASPSTLGLTTPIHQVIDKEQFKLKTQAKRMIKRFEKTDYEIREENIDTDELSKLIAKELAKKLPLYSTKAVQHLFDVVKKAEQKGFLYKVGVFEGNKLKGGLIGLKFNNQLLYLKGTAEEELQKEGAMYALMQHFINYGFNQNCTVDFGGSRVKGIQFFNQRFNGKDIQYYNYTWDNSPLWFKILFSLYTKIKKQ
jgi:Leu/Phe-tRNA-protein transferase